MGKTYYGQWEEKEKREKGEGEERKGKNGNEKGETYAREGETKGKTEYGDKSMNHERRNNLNTDPDPARQIHPDPDLGSLKP